MTKLLNKTRPIELCFSPVLDRLDSDDSYISLPDGHCYLYALADFFGFIPDLYSPPTVTYLDKRFDQAVREDEFFRTYFSSSSFTNSMYTMWKKCVSHREVDVIDDILGLRDEDSNSRYIVVPTDVGHHIYINKNGAHYAPTFNYYQRVGAKQLTKKNSTKQQRRAQAAALAQKNKNNNNGNNNRGNRSGARMIPGGKVTPIGQALRLAGGVAGSLIGQANAGRQLGAGISRIFGQGDYQVQSNSLVKGGPPAFASMNTGMRMAHREYIADVTSSFFFKNTTYDINPMSSTTFPWLSKIAANFEEYTIKGLVFYFNTTSGNAISSTNNALGVVGMVSVYDPTDAPLASKREAEDYAGCVAGVPSSSLLHPVECKPRANVLDRLYIQTTNLTNPEDKKFYSLGTLNVFTQGMQQSDVTIGELWVSYDVEFHNPKILPVGTLYQAAGKFYGVTTTQATNKILGAESFTFNGNLGGGYNGGDGNIYLPSGTAPGYYLINISCSSGSVSSLLNYVSSTSNLITTKLYQGDSVSLTNTPNAATANPWHGLFCVLQKTDANGCAVLFNWSALPTGTLGFDIIVTKLPGAIVPGGSQYFASLGDKSELERDQMYDHFLERMIKQGLVKPLASAERDPYQLEEFKDSVDIE